MICFAGSLWFILPPICQPCLHRGLTSLPSPVPPIAQVHPHPAAPHPHLPHRQRLHHRGSGGGEVHNLCRNTQQGNCWCGHWNTWLDYPQPANMCRGWFFIIIFFSPSYNIVRFFELRVEVTTVFAFNQIKNWQLAGGWWCFLPHSLCRGFCEPGWESEILCGQIMNINDLLFQVLHYSINATWLRRNPIYSVYYIMVIFT